MSIREKSSLISPYHPLPIEKQCKLLRLSRSSYYYTPTQASQDTDLMNEIKEVWLEQTSRGYRRIADALSDKGIKANRKRILRLMKLMGLRSSLPAPRYPPTTVPDPQDCARPYLLKGLQINRPNQVWATDITYIKLPTGMVYLFAIIDWHTRYVVAWKLANTMDAFHAVEVLEEALKYDTPEIMNSDQGSQFTGKQWIKACEGHGIKVSHDGVGRCIDNIRVERLWWSIKYEHVHLYCHQTMVALEKGLKEYVIYYNTKRRHQALKGMRPADLYFVNAMAA